MRKLGLRWLGVPLRLSTAPEPSTAFHHRWRCTDGGDGRSLDDSRAANGPLMCQKQSRRKRLCTDRAYHSDHSQPLTSLSGDYGLAREVHLAAVPVEATRATICYRGRRRLLQEMMEGGRLHTATVDRLWA
jgi:hypothetical protein